MEESALVSKAEEYLKEISMDNISLDNIDEFDTFKIFILNWMTDWKYLKI